MSIATISHSFQSMDLCTAVRQSESFYPTVMATHLSCIAIFGGMIPMTNLRLPGLALGTTPVANVIDSTRVWKRIGFVLMIACGILLAGSKYCANPYFQIKLLLLIAVGIHGLVIRRGVHCQPGWTRRRNCRCARSWRAGFRLLCGWAL